jgi:hypothetical protein
MQSPEAADLVLDLAVRATQPAGCSTSQGALGDPCQVGQSDLTLRDLRHYPGGVAEGIVVQEVRRGSAPDGLKR